MNKNIKMDTLTKSLVIIVIIVHLMFFILESIFWMNPLVYNILLNFLNNPVKLDYPTQAIVLKNLFINQGFYNLFLAFAGLTGLYQIKNAKYVVSYTLLLFLCFAGFGAGIILACSTKAYILAIFQGIPALIAFLRIYPFFKRALITNN